MPLLRTGIQMAGAYAIAKTVTDSKERRDENKYHNQQQYQQPGQFMPQQPAARMPNGAPTYGVYIAPDGTEHPVYQPQPQFQGSLQPVPPQMQNQSSRSISYEPSNAQYEQRGIGQGPSSPMQQGPRKQAFNEPPASSTPPPYQYDRKS